MSFRQVATSSRHSGEADEMSDDAETGPLPIGRATGRLRAHVSRSIGKSARIRGAISRLLAKGAMLVEAVRIRL